MWSKLPYLVLIFIALNLLHSKLLYVHLVSSNLHYSSATIVLILLH